MRKFLINYYFLDYMTKCFGLSLKYPKAAAITYPLFAFAGMNSLHGYNTFSYILWSLTAISLFFEFVYFSFKKVDFKELTNLEDIYLYGEAVKSNKVNKMLYFTVDWNLYEKAREHVDEIEEKRFYKPWRYIMNPFIIVSLVILITMLFYV